MVEKLLIELSSPGRRGIALPELDVPEAELPPAEFLRDDLPLPEVSEIDLVRHFTRLSQLNYCVDTGFYPLGSCTMKYNPKVNERVAAFPGFNAIHPLQPPETVQGAMQLMYELQEALATITGMDAVTLQPVAGAHGELTGMLMVRAYHRARGDTKRTKVLVPASAHGTNPATAAMCGFEVIALQGDAQGNLDVDQLRQVLSDEVAGLMLTMPTTLGLFDPNILEICRLVHAAGAQVYGDGANMNALMGQARPGDLGFDAIHLNLHKTFTGPHGSGGPGSGPVLCKAHLAPFRPSPVVVRAVAEGEMVYRFETPERTIGRVRAFYGNFGVMVRAYAYIRSLGPEGTREVGENAVLNANYVRARLKDVYRLPYDRTCMHEVVFSGSWQRARGVKTLDIAKRLIDYGYHPPTIYFPLVVEEALMIEPTETESIETLDSFIETMREIDRESRENPDLVRSAPTTTKFGRFDEARAARQPNLRWKHPGE